MIFDGIRFHKNKNIVQMPIRDENNNLMPYAVDGKENYVIFGRVVKRGSVPSGAYKTRYTWNDIGIYVYAKPIKISGHSLTNMAYGEDGKAYLMYKGNCYVSVKK